MVSFMTVYSVIASTACICMLSAPIVTARNMERRKSIGIMTPTFFCAQFVSSLLWGVCGVFLNDMSVIICNEVGTAISTYCLLVFLSVARQEEKSGHRLASTTYKESWTTVMASLAFSLVASIIFTIFFGINPLVTLNVSELVASMTSMVMLASPLAMIRTIIKNKNAEGLAPLTLTFAVINTSLWGVYAILTKNPFMFITQVTGLSSSVFQLGVLFKYGRRPDDVKEVKTAIAPVPFID